MFFTVISNVIYTVFVISVTIITVIVTFLQGTYSVSEISVTVVAVLMSPL